MSEIVILAVCFQLKQLKKQPENNSNMIFIYSYSYTFIIIGYMTNSLLTIYQCGLIAQWIEHCTGIARSWVRVQA